YWRRRCNGRCRRSLGRTLDLRCRRWRRLLWWCFRRRFEQFVLLRLGIVDQLLITPHAFPDDGLGHLTLMRLLRTLLLRTRCRYQPGVDDLAPHLVADLTARQLDHLRLLVEEVLLALRLLLSTHVPHALADIHSGIGTTSQHSSTKLPERIHRHALGPCRR